jgi:hypothetical protein
MSCQNNLKQISLASHNHHSAFNKMPPGYLGAGDRTSFRWSGGPFGDQWVGHMVYLFPFMEQDVMYQPYQAVRALDPEQRVPTSDPRRAPWWNDDDYDPTDIDTLWDFAQTELSMMLCPSDNAYEGDSAGVFVAFHTYNCTLTGGYFPTTGGGEFLGRTNYLGVAGGLGDNECGTGWKRLIGVFTNRSTNGFRDMQDGSSNVLLFGEVTGSYPYDVPGQPSARGARQFSMHWGAGGMPTAWGLGGTTPEKWYKFASKHSGGVVNFALGDGAVRGVSNTIDNGLYRNLSGMKDGIVAQLPN